MPRRRPRAAKSPEVEEPIEQDEEVAQDEQRTDSAEAEQEQEREQQQDVAGLDNGDEAQQSLQFNEELSWRPTKPIATGTLLTRLESLSKELADFDQGAVELSTLKDVALNLAHRNLIQHKDKGVRAYTACCLVDLLRLYVPEAPFTDDQLKMMFTLFVRDILPALYDPSNPYSTQHKYVLTSLTEVKSILLIGDIHGADELMLRLFNSTFDGVSANAKTGADEDLSKDVEIHLTNMLTLLIDESPGSVPASVVDAIISQFLRAAPPGGLSGRGKEQDGNQSTLLLKKEPPAYIMAKNICNDCAYKMSRYVSQYFSDVILNASKFATKSRGQAGGDDGSDDEDNNAGPSADDLKSLQQAHSLIRELWRACPTILSQIIPQVDAELSADNVHLRHLATETFGDMISGIGAAGPPPSPTIDQAVYPTPRMMDAPSESANDSKNVLTKPFSPQSFAQSHPATYRNFVGRKNDKAGKIRAAWATATGYILSTSAGGIGLSREEENELVIGLRDKLNDSEEKVRLAAVKAIQLFGYRDVILKLGSYGGVDKEGSIFASLADRCRDRRASVRVEAMILLGKLWAAGIGDLADGQETVTACLSGVPSRIVNVFYANDPDLNILLDRVMFECLVPLKYPSTKGKAKSGLTPADQDNIRAQRILLMLKYFDQSAMKAFFAMQARQPQFAKGVEILIQQCEAYNGGVITAGSQDKVKSSLEKTFQWLGAFFPDPLRVRSDLQKFAKMNDRTCYQNFLAAVTADGDFRKIRKAINNLIGKVKGHTNSSVSASLETIIPLLYRSSPLMFNRSHLTPIMASSKDNSSGLAAVAHQVLNDISQRNPDLFRAHAEELRKEIIEQASSENRTNEPNVIDILKAYSSYAKKYPNDTQHDRTFAQTLSNYALFGAPPKTAKYAINILLAKQDAKSNAVATNLLQKVMKKWEYGAPYFLNRLTSVCQLERLAPAVTVDSADEIHDLTIKQILRSVRTDVSPSDPSWVDDEQMNEELQAKCLSMRILVNQALATQDEADAEDRVKPVFKLLKTFVVAEGEFCKVKDTPLHHKKRLRLLAGLLILKLCTVRKFDDQFDHASFNKLAELAQDSELQVRRRFIEKLQNYLTRGRLKARFYTIVFLVAFEPVAELKDRVETWVRSRARYYESSKKQVMEAIMGRLIPLLAHHPDFGSSADDLVDFSNYFLFYLGAIASEENIALIYKYAERVKQTRDGLDAEASESLYVLSDVAQLVTRKYLEKRNWSFQAYPGKVGLPTGLYVALPSSDVAQQIAKKQYVPEELDERLDDLVRQIDRKKKRKSVHEWAEPPAKKPKTRMNPVIRSKQESKPKTTAKKSSSARSAAKNSRPTSSVPESDRRRSGRAHQSSNYAEREDDDDDAEMLNGVAKWSYDKDGSESPGQGDDTDTPLSEPGSDDEDEDEDEDEGENDDDDDKARESTPPTRGNGKAGGSAVKGRGQADGKMAAVKRGVLSKLNLQAKGGKTRRSRRAKDSSDDDSNGDDD